MGQHTCLLCLVLLYKALAAWRAAFKPSKNTCTTLNACLQCVCLLVVWTCLPACSPARLPACLSGMVLVHCSRTYACAAVALALAVAVTVAVDITADTAVAVTVTVPHRQTWCLQHTCHSSTHSSCASMSQPSPLKRTMSSVQAGWRSWMLLVLHHRLCELPAAAQHCCSIHTGKLHLWGSCKWQNLNPKP